MTLPIDIDLPEIIVIREGLLSIQVCTSIPPERMSEIPAMLSDPGTTHRRWAFPDFKEHPEANPIKCEGYQDRWHYLLHC